jgi:uncharacterized metal-binding protein YceD (DUF177 family)
MTTFDLRTLRVRSGDQAREPVEIELEPLVLGGQSYEPRPNPVPAELRVTRASSGTVLELAFDVALEGPCFRCLQGAELAVQLRLREYEATKPESDDERTEYLEIGSTSPPGRTTRSRSRCRTRSSAATTAPASVPSAART